MKAAVLAACLAIVFAASAQPTKTTRPLSPAVKEAIIDALVAEDGEYAARAKYTAVVAKHGQVQPYAYIRNAENYHVLALEGILRKHGISPPTDRYAGKATVPATLTEAANEAVRIEEKSAALYDRLLASASGDAEITTIVQKLQRMTRESHLAAFKAAAENGGMLTADQVRMRVWQKRPRSGT
jgi:hypothetical protein